MKKATAALVFCLAGAILFWQYRQGQAQPSGTAMTPVKVGIVDVPKILTECKANMAREAEGQKRSETIQAEIQQEKQRVGLELERMKRELEEVLKPGTPEHNELMARYFQQELWIQNYPKYRSDQLQQETVVWLQKLYTQMLDEIRLTAVQKGLTIVLEKDTVREQPSQLTDMYRLIGNRKLLYSSPSLDITGEVIERMDSAYDKQQN